MHNTRDPFRVPATGLRIRDDLADSYRDVYTPEALAALNALMGFDDDRKAIMASRLERRAKRAQNKERIRFLDPATYIARTTIKGQDARDGSFIGGEIPVDLRRQWIQGTGPA